MAEPNGTKPNGNGNGPWWVHVIYRIGVPAGIALFLIYFLTQTVSRDISTASNAATAAAAAASASAAAATATQDSVVIMRTEHQELRFYLRAICLNASQTAAARASCVSVEP